MKTVAIIGGGISGLAAAEAIQRRAREAGLGVRTLVLEADHVTGGKIRTIRENGYVIETGPHGFLDKEPKMAALIDRLGLRGSLLAANEAAEVRYIVRKGRLRRLPSKPPQFLTSDMLPLMAKLRLMMEPLIGKKRDENEETVWSFAARRLGREAADVLVDAMVTGIYGGDPKRLSVRAAFPLLEGLETQHGGLIRGQLAKNKEAKRLGTGQTMGGPRGKLHSFKRGLGELIEALEKLAEVRCNFKAAKFELQDNLQIISEQGERVGADALVVATSATHMAHLFASFAPAEAELLKQIRYVPVSVVVQGFDKKALQGTADGFGFLIPNGEGREILGAIWASSVFEGHAPQDRVMMRTLIGGARRPELALDDQLSLRARRELSAILGTQPLEPEHERIIRWEHAIPQYELGHAAKVAAASAIEAKVPGVFLGGNALRGVSVIQCVADADHVAERVVTRLSSSKATQHPHVTT